VQAIGFGSSAFKGELSFGVAVGSRGTQNQDTRFRHEIALS